MCFLFFGTFSLFSFILHTCNGDFTLRHKLRLLKSPILYKKKFFYLCI